MGNAARKVAEEFIRKIDSGEIEPDQVAIIWKNDDTLYGTEFTPELGGGDSAEFWGLVEQCKLCALGLKP